MYKFSHFFAHLIAYHFLDYLECGNVKVHIGINRRATETTTPYIERHEKLNESNLYDFFSLWQKISKKRLVNNSEVLEEADACNGVCPDGNILFFKDECEYYDSHVLKR